MDLCFQDFPNELETLETQYNKPHGALLLAWSGNTAVGCVAIRNLEEDIAELKRMYVQPGFRGHQIGKKLLEQILGIVKNTGYNKIRLDTLPSMKEARQLYRASGFYEIPCYRFNPVDGSVFLEKSLK